MPAKNSFYEVFRIFVRRIKQELSLQVIKLEARIEKLPRAR
jgi:hypothetical protein